MADKELDHHQLDEDMEDTLPTNQEENDSKVTSTDTDINDVANNDDTHAQPESNVEDPAEEPGLCRDIPKDNTPPLDQDRSDCENMETQAVSPITIHSEETTAMAKCEEADGPQAMKLNKDSGDGPTVATEETSEIPSRDDEGTLESGLENPKLLPQEQPALEQLVPEGNVETICFTPQAKSTPSPVTLADNNRRILWIALLVPVVVALFVQLLQPESPLQKKDVHPIDIFHQEMEKMKVHFPSQREELWKRSRIHLQRHFHTTQPSEPVSLILTAGVRAEATLRCLAQNIASALSSALNTSALHLEGVSKSSQDSDTVKSDIDSQLQTAFEGGKPIAVIHRFDELPPGSTLIFYRYCDHENAAFKRIILIFTVLLEEEDEIQPLIRLSEVEEMVTDHLQKKFLSHGHPTAFDEMDIDKYGGLWSRISHLILPVSTEQRIVKTGHC
ncbi:torsin-1A-interacting protein 2-like [Eucyclogobius newberryi]|uniref:torsin-1A-interacting protein 2-like n=1 Tax=Eucyclogobius newberryi TaxID=166745 RepID=UPI003B5BC249